MLYIWTPVSRAQHLVKTDAYSFNLKPLQRPVVVGEGEYHLRNVSKRSDIIIVQTWASQNNQSHGRDAWVSTVAAYAAVHGYSHKVLEYSTDELSLYYSWAHNRNKGTHSPFTHILILVM